MTKVQFEIEEMDEGFILTYKSVSGKYCRCAIGSPMQLQRKLFHLLTMEQSKKKIIVARQEN